MSMKGKLISLLLFIVAFSYFSAPVSALDWSLYGLNFNFLFDWACNDECLPGAARCDKTEKYVERCGDFDEGFDFDPCLEWPTKYENMQKCPGGCGGGGINCNVGSDGYLKCSGTVYCIETTDTCEHDCNPVGATRCGHSTGGLGGSVNPTYAPERDTMYVCQKKTEEPCKGQNVWVPLRVCGDLSGETGTCDYNMNKCLMQGESKYEGPGDFSCTVPQCSDDGFNSIPCKTLTSPDGRNYRKLIVDDTDTWTPCP